ncbi:hypothetical protein ACQEVB_05490 [Pseudonocardia sp. CA-107938]|uniref:hypothetical protein n=1 Tax=Pseudonocardia sp. CA-107938 TaxID=3240021 RepID=UPI003D91616D
MTRNVALVCATGALTVLGLGLIVTTASAAPAPAAGKVLQCTQLGTSKLYLCTETGKAMPTPPPTPSSTPKPTQTKEPRPEPTRQPRTEPPGLPLTAAPGA